MFQIWSRGLGPHGKEGNNGQIVRHEENNAGKARTEATSAEMAAPEGISPAQSDETANARAKTWTGVRPPHRG